MVDVTGKTYELKYPIYLDTAMMVSFLAFLEGGVARTREEVSSTTGARERLLGGRAGIRASLFGASAEAGADASTQNREESSTQSTAERVHTDASLFNALLAVLEEEDRLKEIDDEALPDIQSGDLVRFRGFYRGNPFEDVLAFFGSLMPFYEDQVNAQAQEREGARSAAKKAARSGSPQRRAHAAALNRVLEDQDVGEGNAKMAGILSLLDRMNAEISESPVRDVLFTNSSSISFILATATEYFTRATHEFLTEGEFYVVGKVARVSKPGAESSMNLARRTILGAIDPSISKNVVADASKLSSSLSATSPEVSGTWVQVLPMAIYL